MWRTQTFRKRDICARGTYEHRGGLKATLQIYKSVYWPRAQRRPLMQAMAATIRRAGRRTRYRLRKQVVEPVFGHIKQARGFRQFLLRGLAQVRAEWAMLCTAHNLLKLHRAAP